MIILWVFSGITAFGLVVYILQIYSVHAALRPLLQSGTRAAPSQQFPPISILKPLRGLDDNLFDNLESFCFLDYPVYEIVFALQDENDPACKVVKKIKDKYPEKTISVVIEQCTRGLNQKVNNLIPAYRVAQNDYILISDSNVMVGPDYLKEIVSHVLDPEVGLVTNLIRGVGGRTIGSWFENLHLNSFIMGSVCFLDKFLRVPCVVGKSMLMRKGDLEAIGGFTAFKDVLAEDFIIGREMQRMGKKVVVSGYLINNVNQYWSLRRFLNRHTRWGKLRWKIGGMQYFFELIGNSVLMSFLPLILIGLTPVTAALAVGSSASKIAGDMYLGKKAASDIPLLLYCLTPIKDLVVGIIWFVPIISNTVVWRGNRYKIMKDSLLSPFPETGFWSWRYRITDLIRERFA